MAQNVAVRGSAPYAAVMNAPVAPAPVSFWEWFCAVYPPDEFVYNQQHYFVTIKPASQKSATGNLSIQVPIFCFSFRTFFWRSDNGAAPTFPVRVGIALLSGNDWTFGQWAQQTITGAGGAYDFPFYWPREVPASTQLTITADNTLNTQESDGDCGIVGLEPRRRDVPLHRAMAQGQR